LHEDPTHPHRRILAFAGIAFAVVIVAAFILVWRPAIPLEEVSATQFSSEEVSRGEQLARMGNCIDCHTRKDGEPLTGNRPIQTPLGNLYSANITPDSETGVGGWPRRAFVRAMREGVNASGKHLYPAFPYTHFTKLSDADLDALYAFVMTRKPVKAERRANEVWLPFRFRPVLAGWKLLFLDRSPIAHDTSRSTEWNRGAYLVEALAHCGACHTPRNVFFAEKSGSRFEGGETESWHAPALASKSPSPLPWSRTEILEYLRTGFSANHGIAAGPMAEVSRSLATVPQADVAAIATYIASLSARPYVPEALDRSLEVRRMDEKRRHLTENATRRPRKGGALDAGATLYVSICAGCHEPPANGATAIAQPLALSTVLRMEEPENLVHIILEGIEAGKTAATISMPAFRNVLDQYQIKLLATYLRGTLTSDPPWTTVDATVHQLYPATGTASGK